MTRTLGRSRAPAAVRSTPAGWRDPRLWVGLVIVAVSVLVGARVVGGAEQTTAVWAVVADLGVGDEVGADDVVPREVRFADPADLDQYLLANQGLPDDARLTRGVGAGELLPAASLGSAEEAGVVEVPIALTAGRVPTSVQEGSVVDVWVAAESPGARPGRAGAALLLDAVVVLDAPPAADGFGTSGERQVVVAVPPEQLERLPRTVAATVAGGLVITRRG